MKSRTLSVSIDRDPRAVYDYVSDPRNLPAWATKFCLSVRPSGGGWVVETPQGPVTLRFAERNAFGVLDHVVSPAPGVEIAVPMRVVPNGGGSEVIFTLFQPADMTDGRFAEDVRWVEEDLGTLKRILMEGKATQT